MARSPAARCTQRLLRGARARTLQDDARPPRIAASRDLPNQTRYQLGLELGRPIERCFILTSPSSPPAWSPVEDAPPTLRATRRPAWRPRLPTATLSRRESSRPRWRAQG